MKNIYLSFLLLFLGFSSYAQFGGKSLEKANKYYDNFSYHKAIKKYIEAQDYSIQSQRQLALSYLKIGNIDKSEELFALLVAEEAEDKTAEDIFTYASILQQNNKYKESESWMEVFNNMAATDSRGVSYVKDKEYYKVLSKDNGQFVIKNLAINSEAGDFGPMFYQDKLLFASSREGVKPIRRKWNANEMPFLDIYEAKRIEENELNAVSLFNKKLNKRFHEGPVCFNADQTLMVATTNNYRGKGEDGVIKLKLVISHWENNKWSKPEQFPYNSIEYSVGHATISKDNNWMYFASDMPGGIGGADIYKVAINADGSYGEPINLGPEVNTEGNELFPFIHENNMLFFASNGRVGLGGLDVFVAQIKKDLTIGKVKNLGVPINSNRDDFTFVLDSAMTSGYFASNREAGHGDDDIYSFNLLKPFNFGVLLKGIARDKNGAILANVLVKLYNENTQDTLSETSNEDGSYQFAIEKDKTYKLNGTKEKYFEGLNTADSHTEEPIIYADLVLEKDPGLSLYVLVTDKKTGAVLDSTQIAIIDNMTGDSSLVYTSAEGDYRRALTGKKLNDRGSYNFILEKQGYLSKTGTYNTVFDHEGQYDVHKVLDFTLDEIEVGVDLSTIIDINPIYFDLNKSAIRPDAAPELNKIVKVMNENPQMVVELGSHTDSRGSAAYNEALSDRRAKASAAYVKEKITNPERIYGKGYGETQLINECADGVNCSSAKHQENRRTEFKIIKL